MGTNYYITTFLEIEYYKKKEGKNHFILEIEGKDNDYCEEDYDEVNEVEIIYTKKKGFLKQDDEDYYKNIMKNDKVNFNNIKKISVMIGTKSKSN